MTPATWEMIVAIADDLQDFVPRTAAKLRFIASEVRYLESIVNDRVAAEQAEVAPRAIGVNVVRLR